MNIYKLRENTFGWRENPFGNRLTRKEYDKAVREAKDELFETIKEKLDDKTFVYMISIEDFKGFENFVNFRSSVLIRLNTMGEDWSFSYLFAVSQFDDENLIKCSIVGGAQIEIEKAANVLIKRINTGLINDFTVDAYKSLTVIANCHNAYKDKISDREIELFLESRKYIQDDYFQELLLSFNNCYRLPNEAGIVNNSCATNKSMIRKFKITAEIMGRLTQEERDIIDLNYLY